MKNGANSYINVPRKIIKSDCKNRGSILLLYCYLVRYSTSDGYFINSMENIANDLGSQYKKGAKRITNLVLNLQEAFDFFYENNCLIMVKGNYHEHFKMFVCKLDLSFFDITRDYVSITYSQFDYVSKLPSRIDKSKIFDLMFWILNCSSKTQTGVITKACSYSVAYMMKVMDMNEMTILKYLSKLCGEPGSDAPLIRTNSKTVKIQGTFRRFPNIYVKNDKDYKDNIKNQMIFMNEKFRKGIGFEYEFDDLDGLFS